METSQRVVASIANKDQHQIKGTILRDMTNIGKYLNTTEVAFQSGDKFADYFKVVDFFSEDDTTLKDDTKLFGSVETETEDNLLYIYPKKIKVFYFYEKLDDLFNIEVYGRKIKETLDECVENAKQFVEDARNQPTSTPWYFYPNITGNYSQSNVTGSNYTNLSSNIIYRDIERKNISYNTESQPVPRANLSPEGTKHPKPRRRVPQNEFQNKSPTNFSSTLKTRQSHYDYTYQWFTNDHHYNYEDNTETVFQADAENVQWYQNAYEDNTDFQQESYIEEDFSGSPVTEYGNYDSNSEFTTTMMPNAHYAANGIWNSYEPFMFYQLYPQCEFHDQEFYSFSGYFMKDYKDGMDSNIGSDIEEQMTEIIADYHKMISDIYEGSYVDITKVQQHEKCLETLNEIEAIFNPNLEQLIYAVERVIHCYGPECAEYMRDLYHSMNLYPFENREDFIEKISRLVSWGASNYYSLHMNKERHQKLSGALHPLAPSTFTKQV